MGCFGTIGNPIRGMISWYRRRKEKKIEKKRLKDLKLLQARIAEVVSVQGDVEDVQAEASDFSSLASTTLDIPADPSQASDTSSSGSDGEGVPLGAKSASSDVGWSSGLTFPMSLVTDDLGLNSYSLRKYESEASGMCSRSRAVEEASQVALHQRATVSMIAAVSRNLLPTIPEDEDIPAGDPVQSPRSPERSICSLPEVTD